MNGIIASIVTETKEFFKLEERSIWNTDIAYGIPLSLYAPLLFIVIAATYTGSLPDNMIGASAFLFLVSGVFVYIGDRLPIWKDWIGGGLVLCLAVGAVIEYFALLPDPTVTTLTNFFSDGANMLVWVIAGLIAGSILSMPRTYLLKALPLYVPSVLGGFILAAITAYLGGLLTGYGGQQSILTVMIPVLGGGMGAGGIPLSQIYADATGTGFDQMFSVIVPAIILGNIIAITIGAILNRIGEKQPSLSGDGVLIPENEWVPDGGIEDNDIETSEKTIITGWIVAVVLLVLGTFLANWIPIHYFAIMILSTVGIKVAGFLPSEIEQSAGHFYDLMATGFFGPVLLGIGMIYLQPQTLLETVDGVYFLLVTITVVASAIGAAISGKLFGMFPIESSLCGGLCMSNMGGSGDVAVLAGAKRMQLMPFAQISSRLGGAMMLVIGDIVVSTWAYVLL